MSVYSDIQKLYHLFFSICKVLLKAIISVGVYQPAKSRHKPFFSNMEFRVESIWRSVQFNSVQSKPSLNLRLFYK